MCIIRVTPVSPGKASGRVVFINSKEKKRSLNFYQDKIAVFGDFKNRFKVFRVRKAKGIITERGGITSHGAILARELKIPGVVLPNARKILKEQKATVINRNGTIKIEFIKKLPKLERKEKVFLPKKIGDWVWIRPRRYRKLRFDLVVPGIEKAPKKLWGSSRKGRIKQTSRGYWYKNLPTPEQITKRILKDPEWFNRKIQRRKIVFAKFKKYLSTLTKKLENNLTTRQYLNEFIKCRDYLNEIRPYVDLVQLSVDQVEKEFHGLAKKFLPVQLVISYFDKIIKTSFVEKFTKKDIIPPRGKYDFILPADPIPPYLKVRTRYNFPVKIEREVKGYIEEQPKRIQKKFYKYTRIFPLLAELSEETSYNITIMMKCLTHIVEKLALHLEKNKKIKKADDALDLKVDRFVGLIRSSL